MTLAPGACRELELDTVKTTSQYGDEYREGAIFERFVATVLKVLYA